MRPRRKYLGCELAKKQRKQQKIASMRPRRKYLGCKIGFSATFGAGNRFNEAEA